MADDKVIIGVDLGGTKILTGAINTAGKILGTPVEIPTGGTDPADKIVGRVISSIEDVLSNIGTSIRKIAGLGVGVTGPLDIEGGMILECPQLPEMHFFNLRKALENYFGIPVKLNNDANCLILGESVYGAGFDAKCILGYTLGTGIGCAIINNGKIWNGATGTAAEVWKSPYRDGIIEDYVSGAGVTKIYKSFSNKEKSAKDIFLLAQKGDENAVKTWTEFGEHLAVTIAWGINLIDPDRVILGGSVSIAYPFFCKSMEHKLQQFICSEPLKKTKIITGELGKYAGFIGAACLIFGESAGE